VTSEGRTCCFSKISQEGNRLLENLRFRNSIRFTRQTVQKYVLLNAPNNKLDGNYRICLPGYEESHSTALAEEGMELVLHTVIKPKDKFWEVIQELKKSRSLKVILVCPIEKNGAITLNHMATKFSYAKLILRENINDYFAFLQHAQ